MAKVALGKGLGALLTTKTSPEPDVSAGERVERVALTEIIRSPMQPRKEFRDDQLNELIESIRTQGIIQPLIVRRVGLKYELIAGERRWRAASQLQLPDVPVITRQATDQEVLELALIENLQREDLNPIEEAEAYARLAKDFALRQEDIALKVGRSRAAVANALRLLELEPQVRSWLAHDRISVGHAKVLLGLKDQSEQRLFADMVIRKSATVRDTEKLVRDHLNRANGSLRGKTSSGSSRSGQSGSSDSSVSSGTLLRLQNKLRERFGTQVIIHHGEKKGRLEIEYYGNDDLDRVLEIMGISRDEL
jgi:ParB family chromosome partitioning protein